MFCYGFIYYSTCIGGVLECRNDTCACPEGQFQCRSDECIDSNKVCDEHEDCKDGSDESLEICGGGKCQWIQRNLFKIRKKQIRYYQVKYYFVLIVPITFQYNLP